MRRKDCTKFLLGGAAALVALLLSAPAMAVTVDMNGPLTISGIITQGASIGLAGNKYDTVSGLQSLVTQAILELKYQPNESMSFFVTGKYNADQAYWVLSDTSEWTKKQFDKSRRQLGLLDNWDDVLGECHVTYSNGQVYVRVGKQVVAWGETDGFRLMDQINPLDQRRGISDVEFESSIIPTWLLRLEYRPSCKPDFLQDLNYQFIWNPNPHFRGDELIMPGNTHMGIWAPNVEIPLSPNPAIYGHLGELQGSLDKPNNFSPDGFAYAGRIMATIWDARITLNGYYGRNTLPTTRTSTTIPPAFAISPWDNRLIISPGLDGFYPYFKFVGGTFSKDLPFLKTSALGNVSPVLRFETFYAFNSVFTTAEGTFDKYDEFRGAVGMDWKIKLPLLNPKAFFALSPQLYLQKVIGYPGSFGLTALKENNWETTIMINTTYFHARLTPSFFWLRDWTSRSEFFRYQLQFDYSTAWRFTVGALIVNGSTINSCQNNLQALDNKDNVYFQVAYKF